MKTILHSVRLVLIALVLSFSFVSLPAQEADSAFRSPEGAWRGPWTSPSGYLYLADMHLTVAADSTIEGYINWTLKKSPNYSEISKLGQSGVEYIRGKYDPQSRVLTFAGYKKDDPNTILGLDKYKLIYAENNKVIGGITWNHGAWTATFSLVRE